MHQQLFTGEGLEDDKLNKYAAKIGLDTDRFNRDVHSRSQAARVREDLQSGIESGVFGTPTFFINGEIYYGSWSPDEFLATLKAKMK
jgi:2-hydroxychromene-2-carboxylate isomerase